METVLNMRVTGDQRAQVFADLMERNRSKSVHYVRRALRCDMDTAEDIAQDAFALAYEKLNRTNTDSKALHQLFGKALHLG